MTPTTVTSIQLRTDDASAARATRSVNETHAAEIHQEADNDAMSSPTFLKSFDEGWPLLRNHAGGSGLRKAMSVQCKPIVDNTMFTCGQWRDDAQYASTAESPRPLADRDAELV